MAPKKAQKRSNAENDVKEEEAPPSKVQKTTSKTESKDGDVAKVEQKDDKQSNSSDERDKIIKKLLSNEVQKLAYPAIPAGHGEVDFPEGSAKKVPPKAGAGKKAPPKQGAGKKTEDEKGESDRIRSYTSPDLSPFEQLVCAALLSKPISHNLGLRAIKTILSPPFSLTTPKAMEEVGNEGRREALWEARTQHKEKTATQLGNLVEGVRNMTGSKNEEEAIQLVAIRDAANKATCRSEAIEQVRKLLTTNIKGVGPTGVDIFIRQVQKQKGWESVFPFIDERGLQLAQRLRLLDDNVDAESGAEELAKLVKMDKVKFVTLLDTIIGIELEKKTSQVMEVA